MIPDLASEHLILLVAAVIIVNRGFDSTGLKLNRAAYVVVQAFDFAMVVVLFTARLSELQGKADITIRLFLMAFVCWHMVRNNQSRTRALRERLEDRREEEARRAAKAAAAAAEAQESPAPTGGAEGTVSDPDRDAL